MLRASEAGHKHAHAYMGLIHEEGVGTTKDSTAALEYYQKAAAAGDPSGLFELAKRCKNDKEKHFSLMKEAAELGLPEAQHNLGLLYLEKQKSKTGIAWTLQAAKQNFYPSMVNIGMIFLNGKSEVLANPMAAYIWFKQAAQIENSPQLEALIQQAQGLLDRENN